MEQNLLINETQVTELEDLIGQLKSDLTSDLITYEINGGDIDIPKEIKYSENGKIVYDSMINNFSEELNYINKNFSEIINKLIELKIIDENNI